MLSRSPRAPLLSGSVCVTLTLLIDLLAASFAYQTPPLRRTITRRTQPLATPNVGCNESSDWSGEQLLLHRLLRGYHTDARGVADVQDVVRVNISYLLLRIHGLDERSQVLTTTGLIITDWVDERLRWKPEDYRNVTDIVLTPRRIWLPELALMNGAIELSPDFHNIRALVHHSGAVHWEPGGVFATTCDIEIRHFPFDEQACVLQFGSWAYNTWRMNVTNVMDRVETQDLRPSGEWDVMQTTAEWKENVIPCCPDRLYSYVEFTLHLRRRYMFYVMNIITPCSLLSVLVMIVFCLPPDGGEKISLGISVLLAFTVFLLMVAESIPRTSLRIPIIVLYLTTTMGLGTVSVCLTVFILSLHHRDSSRPVPRWARLLVLRYLSSLLCVRSRRPPHRHRSRVERDWRLSSGALPPPPSAELGCLRGLSVGRAADGKPYALPNGRRHSDEAPPDSDSETQPEAERAAAAAAGSGSRWREKRERRACAERSDWKEMANVLDRLFFWLVLFMMTGAVCAVFFVPYFAASEKETPTA